MGNICLITPNTISPVPTTNYVREKRPQNRYEVQSTTESQHSSSNSKSLGSPNNTVNKQQNPINVKNREIANNFNNENDENLPKKEPPAWNAMTTSLIPKPDDGFPQKRKILVPKMDTLRPTYMNFEGRFFFLEGCWLGNVMGDSYRFDSPFFVNNTQYLLTVKKKTRVIFVLHQSNRPLNDRKTSTIFVFRTPLAVAEALGGKPLDTPIKEFKKEDCLHQSRKSINKVGLMLDLEPTKSESSPYIIICAHTRESEGSYKFGIEAQDDVIFSVPPTATRWFNTPKQYRFIFKGQWKGKSAAGGPEKKDWVNSPQYPIKVTEKATKCVVRLRRTSQWSLPIGMLVLKTHSIDGVYDQFDLVDDDILGQITDYSSNVEITLHLFLQPRKFPYVVVPLVGEKKREGEFEIILHTDHPVLDEKVSNEAVEVSAQGYWVGEKGKACGGTPMDDTFYNCPQFFLNVTHHNIRVTIYQEQMVEFGKCLNASFYVFKFPEQLLQQYNANFGLDKIKFTKDMYADELLIYRRPSSFSPSIKAVLDLDRGIYVIIPCPRTPAFGRDIQVQIRVEANSTTEEVIQLEACSLNIGLVEEKVKNVTNSVLGKWEYLSSGGPPIAKLKYDLYFSSNNPNSNNIPNNAISPAVPNMFSSTNSLIMTEQNNTYFEILHRFFNNPQYVLEVPKSMKVDISLERTCTHNLAINFYILKRENEKEDNKKVTPPEFFSLTNNSFLKKGTFTKAQEKVVSGTYFLKKGLYMIIVTTKNFGRKGTFELSVSGTQSLRLEEVTEQKQEVVILESEIARLLHKKSLITKIIPTSFRVVSLKIEVPDDDGRSEKKYSISGVSNTPPSNASIDSNITYSNNPGEISRAMSSGSIRTSTTMHDDTQSQDSATYNEDLDISTDSESATHSETKTNKNLEIEEEVLLEEDPVFNLFYPGNSEDVMRPLSPPPGLSMDTDDDSKNPKIDSRTSRIPKIRPCHFFFDVGVITFTHYEGTANDDTASLTGQSFSRSSHKLNKSASTVHDYFENNDEIIKDEFLQQQQDFRNNPNLNPELYLEIKSPDGHVLGISNIVSNNSDDLNEIFEQDGVPDQEDYSQATWVSVFLQPSPEPYSITCKKRTPEVIGKFKLIVSAFTKDFTVIPKERARFESELTTREKISEQGKKDNLKQLFKNK